MADPLSPCEAATVTGVILRTCDRASPYSAGAADVQVGEAEAQCP